MASARARQEVAALVAALGAWGPACDWEPWKGNGTPALQPPATVHREFTAVAVATLATPVKARRGGRVLALRVQPGEVVSAGDPLIEFEDLALAESKAQLHRKIAESSAAAAAVPTPTDPAARRELRLQALQHLQATHQRAREEFERWTELFTDGLLARLDFEGRRQEFEELSAQLRAAEAAALQATPRAEPPEPAALRRARRLLERLQELPQTYVVESSWDGTVEQLSVAVGDVPARGAAVATIARAALPRLEAQLPETAAVVAIEEACGVPGPLTFSLLDRTLLLPAPSPQLRPGDECRLAVSVRR